MQGGQSKREKSTRPCPCMPSGPGAIALLVDAAVPPGRLVKTHVVGWKGATSVRAYVQRNERIHYLRLLGADTSKYGVYCCSGGRGGGRTLPCGMSGAVRHELGLTTKITVTFMDSCHDIP